MPVDVNVNVTIHGVMWVIYECPRDFPRHFVVRKWLISNVTPCAASLYCSVHDTLQEARDSLPPGLTQWPLEPGEEPVIAEKWA